MIKKAIKAKKQDNQKLLVLVLLSLFPFSSFVSAQIFQSNDTEIFISKDATTTQVSNQKITESAHIYIVEGTMVKGLQHSKNISITYSETAKKKENTYITKYSNKKKNIAQYSPKEEETKHCTEKILKEDNNQKTFLGSAQSNTVFTPATSQYVKFSNGFFINKKSRLLFSYKEKIQITSFNQTELSAFLTTAKIRPPPFI